MAKTFNRVPHLVDSPDMKYKYFNHINWKGKVDNSNYLLVDQETFEDCNNVFVDEDLVLKSRPAIKILNSGILEQYQIYNVTVFDNITFYDLYSANTDTYKTTYFIDGKPSNYYFYGNKDRKYIKIGDNVFMFDPDALRLFDINIKEYKYDAKDFIYLPVTKLVVNNIVKENESPNELTDSYITRYLYNNASSVNFELLSGNEAVIRVNDKEYTVTLTKYPETSVLIDKFTLTDNNIANQYILGKYGNGIPLVFTSDTYMMYLEYDNKSEFLNKFGQWSNTYRVYLSTNGVVFQFFKELHDVIGIPRLTHSGEAIVYFRTAIRGTNIKDGPYFLDINTNEEYPLLGSNSYLTSIYINDIGHENAYGYRRSVVVNGDFVDNKNFAFCYGQDINDTKLDFPTFNKLCLITCNNGNIFNQTIYSSRLSEYERSVLIDTDSSNHKYIDDESLRFFSFNNLNVATEWYNYTSIDKRYDIEVLFNVSVWRQDSQTDEWVIVSANDIDPLYRAYKVNIEIKIILVRKCDGEEFFYIINRSFLNPNLSGLQTDMTELDALIAIHNGVSPNIYEDFDYHELGNLDQPIIGKLKFDLTFKQINGKTSVCLNNLLVLINDTSYIEPSTPKIICSLTSTEEHDLQTVISYNTYDDKDGSCTNISVFNNSVSSNYTTKIILGSFISPLKLDFYYNSNILTYPSLYNNHWYIETYNITNKERISYYIFDNSEDNVFVISPVNLNVVHNDEILVNNEITKLPIEGTIPIAYNNHLYMYKDKTVYSSAIYNEDVEIDIATEGEYHYFVPDFIEQLENFYFAKDNTLYISANKKDNFKWYFPKINTQKLEEPITNFCRISQTDVALFHKDSIEYVSYSDGKYFYYISKLPIGCKKGADVIVSKDGKYVIFASEKGLAALSYENFVASTDQIITYLSETISQTFDKFNTEPIKLLYYKNWIICYKEDSKDMLLLDIRNNSWWPWTYENSVHKIYFDDKIQLISGDKLLHYFDNLSTNYEDDVGKIEWKIISQKLHFSAINNYKNVLNLTLNSISNEEGLISCVLKLTNFRKVPNTVKEAIVEYKVDTIRTYVKRINFLKVNEFQYTLSADIDRKENVPLRLTDITIKYNITGQVR